MKKTIYLLVFILIIAGIFAGYFYTKVFIKDIVSGRAETMTKKYMENVYKEYSILGLNCQGVDTDGDAYVSCDVRIQVGDDKSTEATRYLSCPTVWASFTGSTCKERQFLPGTN
jgi:flagellar basal body-associated protein FliL